MSQHIVDHLLRDSVLAQASAQSLARLVPTLSEQCYAAGATIYLPGAHAAHLYLLLDGDVELTSPQGRPARLVHGRFGEEAASDADHYLTAARACSAATVLCIPRRALHQLVLANPVMKTDLLLSLASHLAGERLERSAPARAPGTPEPGQTKLLAWIACLVLPLLVLHFGRQAGLDTQTTTFSAIFLTCTVMWSTSLVDDYIPGLFALLALLVTGLVPVPVVLSGFASDGFLMALSTLALSAVIVTSGLSYRCMLHCLLRLPNGQAWHFLSLFAAGALLTPVIPTANGRIALVAPLYADMLDNLHLSRRGGAATGLAVACFGGASILSAAIMTSKSVNFLVYGLLSSQEQDYFQWFTWLSASAIAAAVLIAVKLIGAACWFGSCAPSRLSKEGVAEQLRLLGPLGPREWAALAAIAFVTVGMLSNPLHKVALPWLAFAMLLGLLLYGTLHKKELAEKIDWTFLLYLGGVTGIVEAIHYLGLDQQLGAALPFLGRIMRTQFDLFIVLLFVLVNVVRLVVPINATVVMLATVLIPLAEVNGMHGWPLGFVILLFAESWFMPYQCSYYLLLRQMNREYAMYDEASFLSFNAMMNLARLGAVYASLPYWKMLGLL